MTKAGIKAGKRGRGRPVTLTAAVVREIIRLRRSPERYTWDQIAERVGVHRDTAGRAFRAGVRGR